jgi:hypothetical protein
VIDIDRAAQAFYARLVELLKNTKHPVDIPDDMPQSADMPGDGAAADYRD